MQPDKIVRLSLNAEGFAVPDQDPVPVKKSNQKVKWCASFPFTIQIEGYKDVAYGSDGDAPHHCKTGIFDEERRYKYSIIANGKTNDPDLDVKP